jgi:hypothetical protein
MELEQQQQLGCGKSAVVVPQGISLREPRLEDLEELSNIAYQTYADYNKSVGIPIEVAFDTPQAAWKMLHLFIPSSSFIGVVAVEESSGALLGAAFTTTGLLHFLLLFHHPPTQFFSLKNKNQCRFSCTSSSEHHNTFSTSSSKP